MFANLADRVVLFAQDAGGAGAAGGAAGGGDTFMLLQSMLPFVAIFILFYFLLIRPQRKEQSRRQTMLAAIKKNDRVLTVGGIYGVVTNVHREADEVTIKVDETTNTKLRMTLSSVSRVMGDELSTETIENK